MGRSNYGACCCVPAYRTGLIVPFPFVVWIRQPHPPPTREGIAAMPWRTPLGGLIGAVAVVAGLLFVDRAGAGTFGGLTARRTS